MARTKTKNAKKSEAFLAIGAETSILTLGKNKVEVSADGKTVTAYTNQAIEVKAGAAVETSAGGISFNLRQDFNGAVLNGVRIEQAADGHLVITAADSKILSKPLPQDAGGNADDWIYIGPSVDTGRPLYVAPKDSGIMSWRKGNKIAAELRRKGQFGARLPSERELEQIFNNRAKITGLNENWHTEHWSSTNDGFGLCARTKCLTDGKGGPVGKGAYLSVRLVRG
ncbi:MAG: hypothetical protein KGL10_06320 [Alphaproteobacteria bacterium]|nr:hypothetical protein [Alphaproteobacteria bacterium]MDE2336908.1 hypothetical protein [Alphaproteobacteria bacterium]